MKRLPEMNGTHKNPRYNAILEIEANRKEKPPVNLRVSSFKTHYDLNIKNRRILKYGM